MTRSGMEGGEDYDVKEMRVLNISDYMRECPFTIGNDISVEQAFKRMRANDIRHLPVLRGGELVGIVSDRDLNLVYSLAGGKDLKVEEVMTEKPYAVAQGVSLKEVIQEMAKMKYGAVVILDRDEKVTGIFTATDALQILTEALNTGRVP